MALNIRNREAEALAERITALTGETKTHAVTRALRERLERLQREGSGTSLADRLDAIALRSAALPVRDNRSADEILGYDDNGAPS
jgi:antitoxin VapB